MTPDMNVTVSEVCAYFTSRLVPNMTSVVSVLGEAKTKAEALKAHTDFEVARRRMVRIVQGVQYYLVNKVGSTQSRF